MGVIKKIKKWLFPPMEIDTSLKVEGAYNSELKRKLTICIGELCKKHKRKKVGETGDYLVRSRHKDYAKYKTMYVLYSSENPSEIDELELYYITKFKDQLDNKRDTETKNMVSTDGLYYLYLVVR